MEINPTLIVLTLLAYFIASTLGAISQQSLTATYSNQAVTSDYTFQLMPDYSYSQAQIRIGFPTEYDLSLITNLQCFTSKTGKTH